MTSKPATSAAEYLEATHDSNKQRELHPADMGNLDLEAFALMSRDGQRRAWLAASADDKRGIALQIIRSRNIGPDEATVALYFDCCERKFGSDRQLPETTEILVAADERRFAADDRGDGQLAARYARLARAIEGGARLAWSHGLLLVTSTHGPDVYSTNGRACDCPNSRSRKPNCWHLLAHGLLLELLDERAGLADEVDGADEAPVPEPPPTDLAERLIRRLVAARAARIAA